MTSFTQSLAIVIGIDAYDSHHGIHPLKSAVNDATRLAKILEQDHGYTVLLLRNEEANLSAIITLLEKILPDRLDNNSRLLFYFAGHGVVIDGQNERVGYVVPQDAKSGDFNTMLTMRQLHDALISLNCRHCLLILDCCFAGSFHWAFTRDLDEELPPLYWERYERFISDPAWQVITSAASDERALDIPFVYGNRLSISDTNPHSPFALALFAALRGAADRAIVPGRNRQGVGVITATELYLFIRNRLDRQHYYRQTPSLWPIIARHNKGEYVFYTPCSSVELEYAPEPDPRNNPYRGLEPFRAHHSKFFFGRKALVDKLIGIVRSQPLTAVVGPSGSGKSSLVKAGLIASLARNSIGIDWYVAQIRPGPMPAHELAKLKIEKIACLLQPEDALPIVATTESAVSIPLETLIREFHIRLRTWKTDALNAHLLLIIDQFEELITLCKNSTEKNLVLEALDQAFVNLDGQIHVVLTVRSDFLSHFEDTVLHDKRKSEILFHVRLMTYDELYEAITKPAELQALYFESDTLVNEITNAVVQMPGALPLLSFTLSELYIRYVERSKGFAAHEHRREITNADYIALGKVEGSLSARAEEEYEKLDVASKSLLRRIILRMVTFEGNQSTKRRVPLTELKYDSSEENTQVEAIIKQFIETRLIVKGADESGNEYVEPAHDALFTGWIRLWQWIQVERNTLQLQRRLNQATIEWMTDPKPTRLWDNRPELITIENLTLNENIDDKPWLKLWIKKIWDTSLGRQPSLPEWLNNSEKTFVQESQKKRDKDTKLRYRVITFILMVLCIITWSALVNAANTREQLNITDSQRLSIIAQNISNSKPETSLLLARSAVLQNHNSVSEQTLRDSIAAIKWSPFRTDSHKEAVTRIVTSKSGSILVTSSKDGSVFIRNREGEIIRKIETGSPVYDIDISVDEKYLATAQEAKIVIIWDLESQAYYKLEGYKDTVTSARFSHSNDRIVTTSLDGSILVWDLINKLPPIMLPYKGKDTTIAIFTPDDRNIVTGSASGIVLLWQPDLMTKFWPKYQLDHNSGVLDIIISSDGNLILVRNEARGNFNNLTLWNINGEKLADLGISTLSAKFSSNEQYVISGDIEEAKVWKIDGTLITTIKGHTGAIFDVSFNNTQSQIVTSSSDGTARIWSTSGTIDSVLEAQGPIAYATYINDSRIILTIGTDGSCIIWKPVDRAISGILDKQDDSITAIGTSANGDIIVTGGGFGVLNVWDRYGSFMYKLIGHEHSINSINFTKDGSKILTSSEDGTARLWSISGDLLEIYDSKDTLSEAVFSPDEQYVLTGADGGNADLWSIDGRFIKSLKHNGWPLSLAFSPDGKYILTGTLDGFATLWDIADDSFEPFAVLEHDTRAGVRVVRFSKDGSLIITGTLDGSVKIWNNHGILQKDVVNGKEGVLDIEFSPNGKYFVTAFADGTAAIWDLSGSMITELVGHRGHIFKARFSPDSTRIVTAAADGLVFLWNIQGELLIELKGHSGPVIDVIFTSDGKYIITASRDKTVRIFYVYIDDVIKLVPCLVVQDLSPEDIQEFQIRSYRKIIPDQICVPILSGN